MNKREPIPQWIDLTLQDGAAAMIPVASIKRIDDNGAGGSMVYVDKEPMVVLETYDRLRELIVNHEMGGYATRD